MKIAKARTDEEKKEIYGKWEKLINMSEKQLLDWAEDDDRFLASLNRARAEEEGDIQSGYDSFHRIKRRKIKPMKDWSAQDFDNASQENGFNSRMLGGEPGQPVKDTGMSKWEISLKNWGHDPSKKSSPSYDKWKAWDNKHNKKAFFNRFLIQKAFHKKNGSQTMRTASRILWYNVNFKDPHTGHIEVYAEELSKRDAESDVRDIKSHGGDAWVVPVTSQDQFNKANSALGYRNATTLKAMRRTASEILRDLEIRVAKLERTSARGDSYVLTDDEVRAVEMNRRGYGFADIILKNLDYNTNTLTLDNMTQRELHEEIFEGDGLGTLDNRSGLVKWIISLEPV
jgi:hypothetical protein